MIWNEYQGTKAWWKLEILFNKMQLLFDYSTIIHYRIIWAKENALLICHTNYLLDNVFYNNKHAQLSPLIN